MKVKVSTGCARIDENNRDYYPLMKQWIPPTQKSDSRPIIWIIAAIVIIAVVGAALLVYRKISKKTWEEKRISPEAVM